MKTIVFNTVQAPELFPPLQIVFNGSIYTLVDEIYNNHPDTRPQNIRPYEFSSTSSVPGKFVSLKNNQNVFVKEGQGYPSEIKEMLTANNYNQFKVYESLGVLVWEHSLDRDFRNTNYTNTLIEKYGSDYINTALENKNKEIL